MPKQRLLSPKTAADTSRVLAWRLPMLAAAMVNPTPQRRTEIVRMVTEKQQAVVAGAVDAQMALWRAMMVGSLEPHKVGSDVISAAHAPALKTLKKNARRASRRKSL